MVSVVTSVAVAILVGVVLNLTPWGLQARTWLRITVRLPCRKTRFLQCQRTAFASALHSVSRPAAARSSGVSAWSTSRTCWEMIGPSSRSALT